MEIDDNLPDQGSDEENLLGGKHKNSADALHQKELEMERQLKLKRDQAKRKNDFSSKVSDLIEDEKDRDNLIEGFDSKMRALDNMMKSEAEKQEEALREKLREKRLRRKAAEKEVKDKTAGLEMQVFELERQKETIMEEKEDVI